LDVDHPVVVHIHLVEQFGSFARGVSTIALLGQEPDKLAFVEGTGAGGCRRIEDFISTRATVPNCTLYKVSTSESRATVPNCTLYHRISTSESRAKVPNRTIYLWQPQYFNL